MIQYQTTRDTSQLIESIGFWSGDSIYFNTVPKQIIIIDQDINTNSLQKIIYSYLEKYLAKNIELHFLGRRGNDNETFAEYVSKGNLRRFILVRSFSTLNKKFTPKGIEHATWHDIANWLKQVSNTDEGQRKELALLITKEVLANREIVRYDVRVQSLFILLHPWLWKSLDNWQKNKTSIEDVLNMIAAVAYQEEFSLSHRNADSINKKAGNLLSTLRKNGMEFPPLKNYVDTHRCANLSSACEMLLGLLRVKRHIILPPTTELFRSLSQHDAFKTWLNKLKDTNGKFKTTTKTLASRIYGFSTIQSLKDTPENIADIATSHLPDSGSVNSTFNQPLKAFAKNNGFPTFPLKKLNRLKAKRGTTHRRYSIGWLKENDIPKYWISFAELLWEASDSGEDVQLGQMRTIIEWACSANCIQSPASINPSDLRDPHNPTREHTLFKHINSLNVSGKWDKWNQAERAFRLVHNLDKLNNDEEPLLPVNPFQHHNNPFNERKPQTTHRHRIPTNVHEAMLHTLLSPDKDGNATYSFVKDTLGWDWFNWTNPTTGESEQVWSPSRAACLAFLLVLPLRSKQARWLDQGLMDQKIWDIESNDYVANTHNLKDWIHPKTGKSHLETYGRPSGALTPVYDDWYSHEQLCIYINTNKTKMWNPERKTGYEIWWPNGDSLRESDIANLAKQADYLDRPYNILESQIRWVQKYDQNPTPVTFMDSSSDATSVNKKLKDEYPYFVPIFRDLTSTYHRDDGTEFFLPVTRDRLHRLFNALAYHTEKKLHEQGLEVVLTKPSKSSARHKGYISLHDIHCLRVYGVSYLLELGIPWPIVQMIVGHATPAMTLHYNKPTPDFIRKVLSSKITDTNILSGWEEIGEDILNSSQQFVTFNTGFENSTIPGDLLEHEYSGFMQKPGGMCPLGGTACDVGQIKELVSTLNSKVKELYGPVDGGCGNCRFFCTTPAHLFQHQMVINDLFIRIRSFGKQQAATAERLSELKWKDNNDSKVAQEIINLQSQIEDIERQIEPMVREWTNRTEMAMQTVEHLDDFIKFIKEQKTSDGSLMLISASTPEDLAPEITFRLEKTGEFELARQSLLAAQLQGGIEQCSELTRLQVREFMDRIMIHDNPEHLLIHINDEKTRDKVAFLMSEAMATIAGSQTVQKAINDGSGLKDAGLTDINNQNLKEWISNVFNNAKQQGSNATLSSLLPTNIPAIKSKEENTDEH